MKDNLRAGVGLVSAAVLTLLLIFTSQQSALHSEASGTSGESTTVINKELPENNAEEIELAHTDIVSLTDHFMNELVQSTDEWYKVTDYESKEAFIDDFTRITSRSVAEKYINTYYVQEEDGLYVIPTSTPPWFHNDQDYTIEAINDTTFKVTQKNISDLYGEYTLELEFSFEGGWKITETQHY